MNDQLNFSQQSKIFNPSFSKSVTVIGVGSVGSQVVCMLSKMGVSHITVYDADHIESHNIPMSVYRPSDLAMLKVEALETIVLEQSGIKINAIAKKYTGEKIKDSVISCVDWMDERMLIWEQVKHNPNVDIFIDTRTGGEMISVFAINPCDPDDVFYYEHFLYPSSDAIKPTCGRHGIFFISAATAAKVCGNLTNWWKNAKKETHWHELGINLKRV